MKPSRGAEEVEAQWRNLGSWGPWLNSDQIPLLGADGLGHQAFQMGLEVMLGAGHRSVEGWKPFLALSSQWRAGVPRVTPGE